MARIPKVLESADGNGQVGDPDEGGSFENRRSRAEAVLRKAEHFAALFVETMKRGDAAGAKLYRKRAHQEARLAARLIGVLEIEFGFAMGPEVERAKKVFQTISPPTGVEARS